MALNRPRLSAFVIVHNEERQLGDCLESLRGLVDELVILDDGSTDATVEVARKAGARVEHRAFDGFGSQKQAALDLTSGDWVFSIDADERVTPELAREIREMIASSHAKSADGYWIRRELVYLGEPLHFGGTGSDWVLRLARRANARFVPLPIHERMEVEGRTARLRHTLRHVQYHSLSEHIAKMDRYTDAIAQVRVAGGRRFHRWHLLRIPWELFARLVLRMGILDGDAGVIYAGMASYYAFLKSAKSWGLARGTKSDRQPTR
jgi:hypothetical protein